MPAVNVALVDYDSDPDLDQLLEQRDPAVRDRVGRVDVLDESAGAADASFLSL